ncbi:MAG: hypothetical protein ACI865_002442 [Flavobacteriaceae bacterium]|jgi:hypothetical protein
MKFTIAFLIGICAFAGNSQTDIIEFRSHSGNMSVFTKFSTPMFVGISTNFGMAPLRIITTAALDTVKFLDDDKAVMITSEYCNVGHSQFFDEYVEVVNSKGDLWNAGTDTMLNHPLFSHQHSLDSIKLVLATQYNFQNPIDSIVFIGFDNLIQEVQEGKEIEMELQEIKEEKRDNDQFGLPLLIGVLLPFLLVYIASPFLFGWMKKR